MECRWTAGPTHITSVVFVDVCVSRQHSTVAVHRKTTRRIECVVRCGGGHWTAVVLQHNGSLVLSDLLMQLGVLANAVVQVGDLGEQPRPARGNRCTFACPTCRSAFRSIDTWYLSKCTCSLYSNIQSIQTVILYMSTHCFLLLCWSQSTLFVFVCIEFVPNSQTFFFFYI